MYNVLLLKLDKTSELDSLAQISGELYSKTITSFWRTVRNKNLWLKPSSLMRWHTDSRLHAHTADAIVQEFFAALKSWRKRRKEDSDSHPPRRRRKFGRLQWKTSAIKIRNGFLMLSNGKITAPLKIKWSFEKPTMVEIGWDGKQYELRAIYKTVALHSNQNDKVVGIDLGEIHVAAVNDGENTTIVNGRFLRSVKQYQNKLKAKLSRLLDVKKKGSKHRKKLARSKTRQLAKVKRQVKDILHKQTTNLVSTLCKAGVQTLAIGDVRTIRQKTNLGKKANQKIHQWLAGATRFMLTYKAEKHGMQVALVDEHYTSQTCPQCGHMKKVQGRVYKCSYKPCGAIFHRDAVGAFNIRAKYLENYSFPVVGVHPISVGMASPVLGVRFNQHLSRSSCYEAIA